MYLQHFGLTELPFSLTPNTSYFVQLAPHVEAMQVLQTALQMGEGFIKVTGEVGTGKTLLCRKLLNELSDEFQCAYIPNPYLTPAELSWAFAKELGMDVDASINQVQLAQSIQQRLLELALAGKTVVLVLDEAQAIPDETLEALRLYTNLETEQRKLLHLVLFGQPELDQRLMTDKFRQLRQRIGFSYQLRPLNQTEVHNYIEQRLRVAGFTGVSAVDHKVTGLIATASRGTPRLINILTHKALMVCFGEGQHKLTKKYVIAAVTDTEDASTLRHSWFNIPVLSSVLLIILGLVFAMKQWGVLPL
ncbi:AAA family ATPase [Parashewanella spongiae]|uniref:AAA family ATPase n=1 Tax=Parashewanella spongiae TaxID=342950 RepID=A0A3A6TLT9_9GAMM|nr:AAA family ATPase [Parashewanella spongiae]MCL1078239.1 AAA family ATPase [Parashewanella spongiae]RJY15112.1 AAA family ATPase [Parashewanella spongiae]